MIIWLIILIVVITGLTAITVKDFMRIKELENHVTQLVLDVEMLIQNSNGIDK